MMSLTFGLFTQVSGSGPLGPLVSFQNNPKNLDPSYKMDLDLGKFRKGKTRIIAQFHRFRLFVII